MRRTTHESFIRASSERGLLPWTVRPNELHAESVCGALTGYPAPRAPTSPVTVTVPGREERIT